jgi:hypothetical protein
MEQPPKEPTLEEQVESIRKDVAELARKLKISPEKTLSLLSHRELVIMNTQLRAIHEMLDLLYARKAKGRTKK